MGKEELLDFSEIAKEYLKTPLPSRDTTFGICEEEGLYYIGDKQATIVNNNVIIGDEKFERTPRLWELIMTKTPVDFTDKDYNNYRSSMIKTLFMLVTNQALISQEVVISSDPNALLERLDLLLASQEAGNTCVRNELVSICDELKRQDVLDTRSYKKLNSVIKKC